MIPASFSVVARRFDFVKETDGENRGAFVEFFQRFTNNRPGDPWCASFASVILDIAYHGAPPFERTAVAHSLYLRAQSNGQVIQNPVIDALFFLVDVKPDGSEHAHHVGFVSQTSPKLLGISGNDYVTGELEGVYEHEFSKRQQDSGIKYVYLTSTKG